ISFSSSFTLIPKAVNVVEIELMAKIPAINQLNIIKSGSIKSATSTLNVPSKNTKYKPIKMNEERKKKNTVILSLKNNLIYILIKANIILTTFLLYLKIR